MGGAGAVAQGTSVPVVVIEQSRGIELTRDFGWQRFLVLNQEVKSFWRLMKQALPTGMSEITHPLFHPADFRLYDAVVR